MAWALVVLVVAPASAHSETVRSDPPDGGMVSVGRTSLTVWFDEPVGPQASSFQVHTLAGLEVAGVTTVDAGGQEVVIVVAPLERGLYALDWHALSLADGHASSGTIVFGAGLRPDVVAARGDGRPPIAVVVLRWCDLAALLLAIGSLTVGGRVLGAAGTGSERLRDQVRGWGVLAGWASLYAGLVTPFVRTWSPGSELSVWAEQTWLTLSGTEWGRLWLVREIALVVAVLAMTRWRRTHGASVTALRTAAASLVVVVLLQSWGGHAATLPTGSAPAALMGAGHVLASGVWAGGLVLLVALSVPVMRGTPSWRGARLGVWRTYSPRAAVAAVMLLATGTYQAGHHVPDLDSLRSTVYGGAIAAKLILVVLALALAAVNTLLVHPGLAARLGVRGHRRPAGTGPSILARTLTAEAVALVLALVAAAVLTSVPTARELAVATRPSSPDVASADGLFMTFEAVPAGTGRTRLILRMRSTIQPEPAPVDSVEVRLEGPGGVRAPVSLEVVEEGRYEASTEQLAPGQWRGTVSVRRGGLPDARMTSAWGVPTAAEDLDSPLRRVSTTLSWILLVGLAAMLLVWRRRRRADAAPDPQPGIQPDREADGEPVHRHRLLERSPR